VSNVAAAAPSQAGTGVSIKCAVCAEDGTAPDNYLITCHKCSLHVHQGRSPPTLCGGGGGGSG